MADLTLQPSTKDTVFSATAPDTNYGTLDYLQIGHWSTSVIIRAILNFDASAIPAGSTINSATMSLDYWEYNYGNPSGQTAWAYKITRNDWVELEATWNSYKTGFAWTTAGGDYVTSNPAGGSVAYPASYGWVGFDITAIVQDAVNNVSGSVNVLIKFADETITQDAVHRSKEYATASLRPKLVISYTLAPATRSVSEVLALVDTTNKKAGFRRSLKERG